MSDISIEYIFFFILEINRNLSMQVIVLLLFDIG